MGSNNIFSYHSTFGLLLFQYSSKIFNVFMNGDKLGSEITTPI